MSSSELHLLYVLATISSIFGLTESPVIAPCAPTSSLSDALMCTGCWHFIPPACPPMMLGVTSKLRLLRINVRDGATRKHSNHSHRLTADVAKRVLRAGWYARDERARGDETLVSDPELESAL